MYGMHGDLFIAQKAVLVNCRMLLFLDIYSELDRLFWSGVGSQKIRN